MITILMAPVMFIAGFAWMDVEQLEWLSTFLHELGHWVFAFGQAQIIGGTTYTNIRIWIGLNLGSMIFMHIQASIVAGLGVRYYKPLVPFAIGWSFATTRDVFLGQNAQFGGDMLYNTAFWRPTTVLLNIFVFGVIIYTIRTNKILGFSQLHSFIKRLFEKYERDVKEAKYGRNMGQHNGKREQEGDRGLARR